MWHKRSLGENLGRTSKPKKTRITHIHHYNEFMLAGLVSFPLVALIISPFLHELFHMLVLKFYGCSYWVDFHFSVARGIYAAINHSCALASGQFVVLYLSGIAGTLAIGFLLLSFDWLLTERNYLEYSIFTSFIAMGFLFPPVIYFFTKEGDLVNALHILGAPDLSYLLPFIGVGIMILSLVYFMFNLRYTSEKELVEEEKEELDRFGVRKTRKEEHKRYMPK